MADLKATLTRKIGPLPVWGWIGVVAGGVFVGRKLLGSKASGIGTSILSGGTSSQTAAETGFGESALPVDVTGRAPTDVAPMPGAYDTLPIDYFPPDYGGLLPDPGVTVGVTPQPSTTTATRTVAPCTKQTKQPGLGRYPDAPNRECPQGWHLNRIPLTPCFGYCVPN